MRGIVQRVSQAQVRIDGEVISQIGQGLLVFVAITHEDGQADLEYIANKVSNLRIFSDEDGNMNLSAKDVGGQVLLVSQFTLYGDARKGRRPSFTQSASGDFAKDMYERLGQAIEDEGLELKFGEFGADMEVELINDGPVTIQLDSSKLY